MTEDAAAIAGPEGKVALKILHTADWHLGKRFKGFDPDDQVDLQRARTDVVDQILHSATAHQVDAVIVAGDVFDEPNPREQWWRELAERLRARPLGGTPVILLPGNHDPLTSRSVWHPTHAFRAVLPDWVHVVDRDDWELALSDEAVVVGRPCRSKAGELDLVRALPARAAGDDRIRIGLVHGSTFEMPGAQTNFPIYPEAAAERGLDYLAIGDHHGFRLVQKRPVPVVYPGSPEATRWPTPHPEGHVALVYFARKGRPPVVRREKVGRWSWEKIDCTRMDDLRTLRDAPNRPFAVVRLILDLVVSLSERAEYERIVEDLKGTEAAYGRIGILDVDDSGLRLADDVRLDEFPADMPALLTSAVERLRARLKGGVEADRARLALYHLWRLVERQERQP